MRRGRPPATQVQPALRARHAERVIDGFDRGQHLLARRELPEVPAVEAAEHLHVQGDPLAAGDVVDRADRVALEQTGPRVLVLSLIHISEPTRLLSISYA